MATYTFTGFTLASGTFDGPTTVTLTASEVTSVIYEYETVGAATNDFGIPRGGRRPPGSTVFQPRPRQRSFRRGLYLHPRSRRAGHHGPADPGGLDRPRAFRVAGRGRGRIDADDGGGMGHHRVADRVGGPRCPGASGRPARRSNSGMSRRIGLASPRTINWVGTGDDEIFQAGAGDDTLSGHGRGRYH